MVVTGVSIRVSDNICFLPIPAAATKKKIANGKQLSHWVVIASRLQKTKSVTAGSSSIERSSIAI